MSHIVGLGGSTHDFSACIAQNGRIVVAIEAERLTRKKHSVDKQALQKAIETRQLWKLQLGDPGAVLDECIEYCLKAAGLSWLDIDSVASTDTNSFRPAHAKHFLQINHHLAHAASAFYPSGLSDAAILVVDGHGSLVKEGGVDGYGSVTFARGHGTRIEVCDRVLGHSVGHFYEAVTMGLGFGPLEEGKTMGLAPWGRPSRFFDSLSSFVTFLSRGQIVVTQDDSEIRKFVRDAVENAWPRDGFQIKADIAFAAQQIVQKCMVHFARHACELSGSRSLCLAGGVALNSVANGEVARALLLESVFVQPASGDNGLAIGAALHAHYASHGSRDERRWNMQSAGLGRSYSPAEIQMAVEPLIEKLPYKTGDTLALTARLLANGYIGGWFQGSSEFGPRSLGFRSILADARRGTVKDYLNGIVKRREPFRPFAPAILAEHRNDYFDCAYESPSMLLVTPVHDRQRDAVPAIVHVDGTARLQTVTEGNNPLFRRLLLEFHRLTGCPLLLNTSFNGRGEPIVETPQDAVQCFLNIGLAFLAIGDFLFFQPHVNLGQHS